MNGLQQTDTTPHFRMNISNKLNPSLAKIEREVIAESREWGRKQLAERLQSRADQHIEVYPFGTAPMSKGTRAKQKEKPQAQV